MIDTELESIKTYACPKCGCLEVIQETLKTSNGVIMQHVNGTKWESRKFLCGQVINYIPNFQSEDVSIFEICTHNHDYIKRKNLENSELAKLHKFIETLDLCPEKQRHLKIMMR